MTPSPLTHDCPRTNRPRWRSTVNARIRDKPPILPTLEPQTSLPKVTPARQSAYSPAKTIA